MSLINEALKRAKQAQPESAHAPAASGTMQPVHYPRRGLPWYFFPTLALVIAGGCWFLIKGWDATRQAAAGYGNPITVKAREPVTPILPDAAPSDHSFTPAVNTAPSVPYTAVNRNFSLDETPAASAETPAAPTPTPTTASITPGGPTFKLQGIFYRSASPSAMVNGKSVFVGDRVSGAKVRAIDRESVTLEFEGQTKKLTLE